MKRIAIIEDNPDSRLLVRVMLESLYEVVDYSNGPDALEGLRSRPPDLVLLDVSLPGMDGAEVLKRIRADDGLRGLPVIALTAHAMAGDREKFLELGFDDYVSKPIVDEVVLLDAIGKRFGGGAAIGLAQQNQPRQLESEALDRLRRLGDVAFVGRMIDLFLEYGAQQLGTARRAQLAGDLAAVEEAAHALKSSAGNVGARSVQELATRCEDQAQRGQGGLLERSLAELERAFAAAKLELVERKRTLL